MQTVKSAIRNTLLGLPPGVIRRRSKPTNADAFLSYKNELTLSYSHLLHRSRMHARNSKLFNPKRYILTWTFMCLYPLKVYLQTVNIFWSWRQQLSLIVLLLRQ